MSELLAAAKAVIDATDTGDRWCAIANLYAAVELAEQQEAVILKETYKDFQFALLTRFYNIGYMAGHHDTVEGNFTDIHESDLADYHSDIVAELINEYQPNLKIASALNNILDSIDRALGYQ